MRASFIGKAGQLRRIVRKSVTGTPREWVRQVGQEQGELVIKVGQTGHTYTKGQKPATHLSNHFIDRGGGQN